MGPGLSLKREITQDLAHELLIWLVKGGKLEASAPAGASSTSSQNPSGDLTLGGAKLTHDLPTSVREFIDLFEPRRVPDRIACFGLYLREHRNQKEFSKMDVISLFQEAAEPLPKNLGRDLKWTQSIAWIAPSPSNRENFYLTKKGEDAVRNRFPKEMLAKTRLAPAPQRRRTNAEDSAEMKTPDNPALQS